ncbi:triose-phosphate isomerase, partial [Francisella tularensis]|uniref:triose-phosphate isomerase n=1 Tax=Francisella tularensis TaxID=263 RepID=UPI0023819ABB
IGHSERRSLFAESDDDVFKKHNKIIDTTITPVVCIGESLDDRKRGKLKQVLATQLSKILENLSVDQLSKVVIAYEP